MKIVIKQHSKIITFIFLCIFIIAPARADITFMLHEAIGFAAEWNSAGHAAIYLSKVCSDENNHLRLCEFGEQGVVLSSFNRLGGNEDYEWIAVPLTPYLFAVEGEQQIPLYANGKIRAMLRENYRRNHLSGIIPTPSDDSTPPGYWQSMIGAAYNRDIYGFTIKTTQEQDAELIRLLTRAPNKSNFGLLFNNCTDFAARLINQYYPNAARKNLMNDFGTTTPKAIARSFTNFAKKHPDLQFRITKFSQVAGPIKRSFPARHLTEEAISSKKYLAMLLLKPHLFAGFAGIYLATGRFDVDKEWRKFVATEELAPTDFSQHSTFGFNFVPPIQTQTTWREYKVQFEPMLQNAIHNGYFADENEVKTFFSDLEKMSEPEFDANGNLRLRVNNFGEHVWLGITAENIQDADSNCVLAYKLMLAKIAATLHAKEKERCPLDAFAYDWQLLRRLHALCDRPTMFANYPPVTRPRFLTSSQPINFKRKALMLLQKITH